MKILLSIIALTILSLPGFSQNVTMQGNIVGLTEKTLLFAYHTDTGFVIDTLQVDNGKFNWSKTLKGPQKAMLFLPYESVPLFIEPGNMIVNGNVATPDTLSVTGSKINDEAKAFYRTFNDLSSERDAILQKLDSSSDADRPALRRREAEINVEWKRRQHAYLKANPSHIISVNLVHQIVSRDGYDEGLKAFKYLNDDVKLSSQGKQISTDLDVMSKSRIGAIIPDFIQNDPDGNPIKFSDFRGKYVYVDFWASWCVPCRAENPNVLKAYEKHKDKNFTVIGVSVDSDLNSWKKAIQDDKMPWTMVSDLKGTKNEIAVYFGIRGVPSTLLIDPKGRIIAKDLVGNKLHHKLDELFSSK